MSTTVLLLLAMAVVAAAAPLVLAQAGRLSPFHPGVALGVPYLLVTTGPVLRYLIWGIEPYGVHLEMLDRALLATLSAQLGITLGCIAHLHWSRMPTDHLVLRRPRRFRALLVGTGIAVVGVWTVGLGARWQTLATLGKADLGQVSGMAQVVHYGGLLLLLTIVPALLAVDQALERKVLPRASALMVGLYGVVCLLSGERDVALALLMIPLAWFATRREVMPARTLPRARMLVQGLGAFAAAAVLLAVLEWARSGAGLSLSAQVAAIGAKSREQSILQSIMGLGSNLFVTSRVVEWVPAQVPHEYGLTYVHTLANMLPSFLLGEYRFESLLTWFKMRYAPTSDSSYGFGMGAEAYLNFGMIGPLLVFALWATWLCRLYDGYTRLPGPTLYRAMYTFFLPFSLYAIRGDSVMLFKGFAYAAMLMWILARLSGVRRLRRRAAVPVRADGRPLPAPGALAARAAS